VLAKALSLEPSDRYADAGEFCEALAEIDPTTIPSLNAISDHGSVKIRDSADLLYPGPGTMTSQAGQTTMETGVPPSVREFRLS